MSYTPKHLEEKPRKKGKAWIIILVVIVILALAAVAAWFAFGRQTGPEALSEKQPGASEQTQTQQAQEPEETFTTIKTKYCDLQFSERYSESLRHVESVQDEVAMEVFYMVSGDTERELFRICFGGDLAGEKLGVWKTDGKELPVILSTGSYEAEEFSNEDEQLLYMNMMDQLDTVLTVIRSAENYAAVGTEVMAEAEKRETAMTYWTVELPEQMQWEETVEGELYAADFYGTVAGERVTLYTVWIGEMEADSEPIGMLQGKPVYLQTGEIQPGEGWTEEDTAAAYVMMDTINDVITAIETSADFAAN